MAFIGTSDDFDSSTTSKSSLNFSSVSLSQGSVALLSSSTSTVLPHDSYPSRMFGSSKRSFPSSWYNHFEWLEYSVEKDRVYCFPCCFFGVHCDPCLTVTGFCNWKNGK